jgi:SecD/SecF fusion protein
VELVRSFNIDFMGKRRVMFAISAVLLVISIGALTFKGLTFGIEFQGGTAINISDAGTLTDQQIATAFTDAGLKNVSVQLATVNNVRGFIVRSDEASAVLANTIAGKVATEVGLKPDSYQVTTIGAGWGKNITNSAILALGLSILAILLYVSLRFDYKMSVTAVIALIHDIIITLGIYALFGREVTPNTVAALLTILGFSLYDTIVVFHRIKENSVGLVKQSFMSMANESINEVLVRSINTSLTATIPVLVMLFFGGSTLKDFAFALVIGNLIGTYSSIGVAAPLFTIWKETEPKYKALAKKYVNA